MDRQEENKMSATREATVYCNGKEGNACGDVLLRDADTHEKLGHDVDLNALSYISQPKVAVTFKWDKSGVKDEITNVYLNNIFDMVKLHWDDKAKLDELRRMFTQLSYMTYDRIEELYHPDRRPVVKSPRFNELQPDKPEEKLICKNDNKAATFMSASGEMLCMECKKASDL